METGSVAKVSNLFDALDKKFFRVAYSPADITAV